MADLATINAELHAHAQSLTTFTKKHGGKFVLVYIEPAGEGRVAFHEVSDASEQARAQVGVYLTEPMGAPELHRAGRNRG